MRSEANISASVANRAFGQRHPRPSFGSIVANGLVGGDHVCFLVSAFKTGSILPTFGKTHNPKAQAHRGFKCRRAAPQPFNAPAARRVRHARAIANEVVYASFGVKAGTVDMCQQQAGPVGGGHRSPLDNPRNSWGCHGGPRW